MRVSNSGPAIPSAEQARIFDRFYRGVEARTLAPGSGLGLYVARKIALAHGGSLDLDEYPGSNGGTAFRFTVPISKSELELLLIGRRLGRRQLRLRLLRCKRLGFPRNRR